MKQYRTLALILARGGSKSIPYKNIYPLCGKPLISYVLRAAKKSRRVDRVIVSTDDKKIARVARQYGADTPFMRPKKLARDRSPSIPVITHALEWMKAHEGYVPDYVLLLQPTDPFVKPEQIDALFDLVIAKKADSGITMVRVPRNVHPYHVRRLTAEGSLVFDKPALHYAHPSRQLDPPRYAFGNAFWFRGDRFMKEKKIEVGRRVGLEIDALTAHDINEKSDIVLAEFLLKKKLV